MILILLLSPTLFSKHNAKLAAGSPNAGVCKNRILKLMRACPPHPRWKLQPRTSIKPSETATRPSPLLHLLIRVYLFITCRHSLTPTAANINDVGIMRTKHFIVLPPYPHPPAPPFPSLFIYASSPKMHINTNGDDGATGRERERDSKLVRLMGRGEGDSDWLGERSRESEEENWGMRDGCRAEEKRRDQHGTNCFLCTPAEPRSAIHHPAAIGPAPTLWQMRPSSRSIR